METKVTIIDELEAKIEFVGELFLLRENISGVKEKLQEIIDEYAI